MRRSWIYKADGTVIEKGTQQESGKPVVYFVPDQVDFVSPIDGKEYRGRAGMREHNKLHDVVSNQDLTGLPTRTMNTEYKPDKAAIREKILETIHRKGYHG